jgi:xylulose-5-phosphate/fructose-6-phosphate phosphoketolase
LTSSGWRQEHNGFSHQNPGFIDNVLQRQGDFVTIYFPTDANSTLAVLEKTLSSNYGVNVIVADKQPEPQWVGIDTVREYLEEGMGIWKFASEENPDIVFCGIGDHVTKEALAGLSILKKELPEIRARFVNIISMSKSGFGVGGVKISKKDFILNFTEDAPVLINFHGYPQTIKQILFDYDIDPKRFKVNGYIEQGSTTTPFDMQVRNGTSRYNLVMDACLELVEKGKIEKEVADKIIKKYTEKIKEHTKFIKENGVDLDEIENWVWGN